MAKRKRSTQHKLEMMFEQQAIEVEGILELICPLCLRVFREEALNERTLSIEHAPQRSHTEVAVERCLTCASCNQNCGFEARAGWRKSKRTAPAHLLPGQPRLTGWRESAPGLSTPIVKQPHVHGRLKRGLLVPNPKESSFKGFHKEDSLVELKTAYLIAFATLGYSYILDPALDIVRWAIASETPITVCSTTKRLEEMPVNERTLLAARLDNVPALVVCIPPSHPTQKSKQHHVYLPRPSSPNDLYAALGFETALSVAGGSFLMEFEPGEVYEFPKEREVPRHWDSCGGDHPRSTFKTKVGTFQCEVHGDERRVFGSQNEATSSD